MQASPDSRARVRTLPPRPRLHTPFWIEITTCRRTASTFVVTAAGGRTDHLHRNDSEHDPDYSFDPVWEVEMSADGGGWTAEVRKDRT